MEHFDTVIVGAGLSGIGAAYHLQQQCPGNRFAILEGRDAIGGTWDLFRYPGVRSDSDMHTLGYGFKPWREAKAIADGPSIRRYVNETANENAIVEHIRFKHLVRSAAWDTRSARWVITCELADSNKSVQISANFLFMCGGYYRYDKAYAPDIKGLDTFQGTLLHPQFWPEDIDYSGKRVIVIGSGATAMTLVPAMTGQASHVTMLQRSPTYVVSRADEDGIANFLRKWLPEKMAYAITRWKNVTLQKFFYNRTRVAPEQVKAQLLKMVQSALGNDYDVKQHFTPRYDPWDQRLCLIPNNDLFDAIKSGSASVVTDEIEQVTATGIRLKSGHELAADLIVTATGLELTVLSGVEFTVDGEPVNFPDTWAYKGMMYSDLPNMVQTFGYINASWTLRADLTCEYVCRLINRMKELGLRQCTPRLRAEDATMQARPWIDGFSAGYMQRVMHLFPKQGDKDPWLNTQNYSLDKKMIRRAALEDGVLQFSNPPQAAEQGSASVQSQASAA